MPSTFKVPMNCNDKAGRKEPLKKGVSQMGQNKPMGEKMAMKGKDTKMGTNNSGEMYQK